MLPELPKWSESLLCRIGIGQDDERERICSEDFRFTVFVVLFYTKGQYIREEFQYAYTWGGHILNSDSFLSAAGFLLSPTSTLKNIHSQLIPRCSISQGVPNMTLYKISNLVGVVEHLSSCPCSCSMCHLIFTKMNIFFSHWSCGFLLLILVIWFLLLVLVIWISFAHIRHMDFCC